MYTVDIIVQREMRMTNGARSDSIVRGFALSSVFWLLVGLVVGLWLAAEMIYPALNLAPWLAFGRLRVVHTNGLTFGFTLAGIFACSFYILEKLTRTPLAFPGLAKAQLWLFNIAIALAALSLFAGMNTSKEYAELEWPLDIVVASSRWRWSTS
jgi:cytochrome c oxidase cbb3-type subunit 1